jgi:Cu-processing system permease protein
MTKTRSPVLTIAVWEMRGAARSRWVLAAAALYALLAVGIALVNLRSMSVLGLRGVSAVVDGLLTIGVLVPPLFGILLGSGVVAGARDQGSLAMVAAQPIPRSSILWGGFLGVTATVWASICIGLGLVAVVTAPAMTMSDLAGLAMATAVTLAAATAGVAIGLLISVLADGRGQATAIAVAVWFLIALGVDVILIALAPVNLGPAGLLWMTLLNPLAAIRTLGLLATDGHALGPFMFFLESRFGVAQAAAVLAVATTAWLAAPLAAAAAVFRSRDV